MVSPTSSQPLDSLGRLPQPVIVLVAGTGTADDEERRERLLAVDDVQDARRATGCDPMTVRLLDGAGHELMRYRPDAVAAAIAELAAAAPWAEARASGTM